MAVIANGGGATYTPPKVPTYKPPPTPTYTPYVAPYTHEETRLAQYDRTTTVAPTTVSVAPTSINIATPAPAPTQTLDSRLYELPLVPEYTHEETRLAQADRVTTVPEQQYSIFGEPIDLEGPTGLSFADQPLAQLEAPAVPQPHPSYGVGITPTYSQLGTSLPDTYVHEEFRLTQYDRTAPGVGGRGGEYDYADYPVALATRGIFGHGVLPPSLGTEIANQLPWDQFGYTSTDRFMTDLGYYYDENLGIWRLGDSGGGVGTGGVADGAGEGSSWLPRASGTGSIGGRYSGAGLINWRIGF